MWTLSRSFPKIITYIANFKNDKAMRRMINSVAALFITMAMIAAPEALAQTRRSGGSSTASRSSSAQTTTRGSSYGRASATAAPSRSASMQTQTSRSSGSSSRGAATTSRSTGSSSVSRSSGVSSTRSASSMSQNTRTNRSTGSSSSVSRSTGSTTTRSASGVDQNTRTNRSTGSSSSTVSRSTGSTTARSASGVDQNTRTTRSTGTVNQNARTTRSAGSSSAGTATTSRSSSGSTVRSTSNVTRNGLGYNSGNDTKSNASVKNTEPMRDNGGNYRYNDDYRMDNGHNMHRIHPRERDFMAWDRPGYFWDNRPHYFGYRVHVLPPHYRRISHWGIDYYFYEGIYYRPFGGVYVVCRPPFGTPLERAIDRALFNLVRFSYYCNTYRTYNTVFDNYNVIAQQNLIIAQNNARIAAQNASYALNSNRALTAYELANKLGLVQSYAYANSDYFYQDGVFYSVNASGTYTTIVPPAGALVTSLPDDYETIVLNGIEYYMVDNTVYRTTLFDGQPYLEVLGQMYGSLYNQYSIYR